MRKMRKEGMTVAGRKPKPTAVKKLEGNPGKRKLNSKEPIPAKGMSDCQVAFTCGIRSVLRQMEGSAGAYRFWRIYF